MTHEMGKPTFQSPRVSHEIKFLALFIHLPVLKQQHCPQISFSVCFVPLSLPPSLISCFSHHIASTCVAS